MSIDLTDDNWKQQLTARTKGQGVRSVGSNQVARNDECSPEPKAWIIARHSDVRLWALIHDQCWWTKSSSVLPSFKRGILCASSEQTMVVSGVEWEPGTVDSSYDLQGYNLTYIARHHVPRCPATAWYSVCLFAFCTFILADEGPLWVQPQNTATRKIVSNQKKKEVARHRRSWICACSV